MTVFDSQNTETPTNTIANTVRALAETGLGHEDIVVRLKAGGMRISENGKERIKQIVLKQRTKARRPAVTGAGEAGRISAGEGAGT